MRTFRLISSLAIVAIGTLVSTQARAHFVLKAPASYQDQNFLGDPQKDAPCGGRGTATGKITTYKPGDTVTITVDETIFHPGHYRIALAQNNESELPANPKVTPGASQCGSVPIDNNPTFPILADGLLPHTAKFGSPQTVTVKLPTNITCTKCTLQIVEFMSSHAAPCFYHHCAQIAISATGGPVDAGAADSGNQTDSGNATPSDSGGPTGVPQPDNRDSGNGGTPGGGTPGAGNDAGNVTPPDATTPNDGGCAAGAQSANGMTLGLLSALGFVALGAARRRRAPRAKRN
jgi:hypothetical protein